MEHILTSSILCVRAIIFLALLIVLSGCAKLNSIYRSQALPKNGPHVISIDAKQRVVLSNFVKSVDNESNPNDKKPDFVRFCSEPPPDVFTALAASLGAEASLSKSSTKDISAKLAATLSENAATIERTQTVNILREAMYRNCERYLSGAISDDEFIIQAARDQQLIVQVLAVEQITGVAKAQSTALTTVAKSAAGGVSDASLATLVNAKKDVDAKRTDSAKVDAEVNTLPPQGKCGDNPIDETNLPDGVTAEQAKAKNAKCAEVSNASKLQKEAEEYYTLVKKTVDKQGSVSSETLGELVTATLTASEASSEIADRVVDIVKQYQAFDEINMTCVVMLRTQEKVIPECKDLIKQMARTQSEKLKLEEDRVNQERVKTLLQNMNTETQSQAEAVWNKLGKDFSAESLQALAQNAGFSLAARGQQLAAANTSFADFVKVFGRLPMHQQKQLADAASPR